MEHSEIVRGLSFRPRKEMREGPSRRMSWRPCRWSSSTSVGLADYYHVDMLGARYKSDSFMERKRARSHQTGENK